MGAGLLTPPRRAEIQVEDVRRLACLRERLGGNDATDAELDLLEVGPGDGSQEQELVAQRIPAFVLNQVLNMLDLRARRGNTEFRLAGSELRVSIGGNDAGSYALSSSEARAIWRRIKAISLPVVPKLGAMGVGGTLSEIEINHGMSHLTIGWWMRPPSTWAELESIFDILADRLPDTVTSRYDFARGGE